MNKIDTVKETTREQTRMMIDAICGFTHVGLYERLFDLLPSQLVWVNSAARICRNTLHDQLLRDLLPEGIDVKAESRAIAVSELEHSLSCLFASQAPFWVSYYARKSQWMAACTLERPLTVLSEAEIIHASRHGYPYFFTTIEAMFFGEGQHQPDYKLMLLSLQAVLTGLLLGAGGYSTGCAENLMKALRLIGPVHAPDYREHLMELLTSVNRIQKT